jgi:hypothetical protein
VRGVEFDSFELRTNTLVEAKGPGYARLLSPRYEHWSTTGDKLLEQAERQLRATRGTGATIEWRVAEPDAASIMRQLFTKNRITGIRIIEIPPR